MLGFSRPVFICLPRDRNIEYAASRGAPRDRGVRALVVKIHEYQAKKILSQFGVPVPRGEVATNAYEVYEIARRLGGTVVVKAQIHAGGRGKGGGVKLAKSPPEAESVARAMLGMTLVTHQTGPEGRVVGRLLIEEGLQMTRE